MSGTNLQGPTTPQDFQYNKLFSDPIFNMYIHIKFQYLFVHESTPIIIIIIMIIIIIIIMINSHVYMRTFTIGVLTHMAFDTTAQTNVVLRNVIEKRIRL